jgi:hypothetical protein
MAPGVAHHRHCEALTVTSIQQARDVLQRWRDDSQAGSPGTWSVDSSASIFPTVRDEVRGEVAHRLLSEDARLVVGTAGNPDLLDAIDGLLELATDGGPAPATTRAYAGFIAAAIIAADERMTS